MQEGRDAEADKSNGEAANECKYIDKARDADTYYHCNKTNTKSNRNLCTLIDLPMCYFSFDEFCTWDNDDWSCCLDRQRKDKPNVSAWRKYLERGFDP
jgi:hypothetical protein